MNIINLFSIIYLFFIGISPLARAMDEPALHTRLSHACELGDIEAVRFLLEQDLNEELSAQMLAPMPDGRNALHVAISNGKTEIIKLILASKWAGFFADFKFEGDKSLDSKMDYFSPLSIKGYRYKETFEALLGPPQAPNEYARKLLLNSCRPLLIWAVQVDNLEYLKTVLPYKDKFSRELIKDRTADIDSSKKATDSRYTNNNIVKLLLESNLIPAFKSIDNDEVNGSAYAAYTENLECLKIIMESTHRAGFLEFIKNTKLDFSRPKEITGQYYNYDNYSVKNNKENHHVNIASKEHGEKKEIVAPTDYREEARKWAKSLSAQGMLKEVRIQAHEITFIFVDKNACNAIFNSVKLKNAPGLISDLSVANSSLKYELNIQFAERGFIVFKEICEIITRKNADNKQKLAINNHQKYESNYIGNENEDKNRIHPIAKTRLQRSTINTKELQTPPSPSPTRRQRKENNRSNKANANAPKNLDDNNKVNKPSKKVVKPNLQTLEREFAQAVLDKKARDEQRPPQASLNAELAFSHDISALPLVDSKYLIKIDKLDSKNKALPQHNNAEKMNMLLSIMDHSLIQIKTTLDSNATIEHNFYSLFASSITLIDALYRYIDMVLDREGDANRFGFNKNHSKYLKYIRDEYLKDVAYVSTKDVAFFKQFIIFISEIYNNFSISIHTIKSIAANPLSTVGSALNFESIENSCPHIQLSLKTNTPLDLVEIFWQLEDKNSIQAWGLIAAAGMLIKGATFNNPYAIALREFRNVLAHPNMAPEQLYREIELRLEFIDTEEARLALRG